MIRLARFSFSTIAIISGAPKYDPEVAAIAATLQKTSNNAVTVVGVAGPEAASGFSKLYASSSALDNYEFEVTRANNTYHEYIQDCPVMPYRSYTHFRNYALVKELEKQKFFEEVFANRVSAVVTVGNFSLSLRISEKLNAYCKSHNRVRPFTALFHRQRTERMVENEDFLDYQYYNVEKQHTNMSGYVFPSLCVGYDGLYHAFQHLQTFKKDHTNDSFASENFTYDVSQLISKSRAKFRADHGISQDKYLIYLDAGINPDQVKFSIKSFKNGLNAFFKKGEVNSIDKSHFELFVHVPNTKAGEELKSKLGYLPQDYKVTLVDTKDKYAVMSAADFGLLHNGEATVQAAALQLPSLVVDNRTNFHAYFNNLYNGHASPLNIATNYEGYEDLCGSLTAIGEKLASIMLKNFQSPKYRYYYAKLYSQQIQKILSKSDTNPRLCVSETGLETGCKHLLSKSLAFSKIEGPFRKESQRKQALAL